jgi:hypothetical protein
VRRIVEPIKLEIIPIIDYSTKTIFKKSLPDVIL